MAASRKTRGEGIGFAGVGIKLGLLVTDEVLTETRRGDVQVATRWHLPSRHRAPWRWVEPPGWVQKRGTAVGLRIRNVLSPLLDVGYVEAVLRRYFEPLLDHAFDEILAERHPNGVAFAVNGRGLAKRERGEDGRVPVSVRLLRKRKPSAVGYLEHATEPLPEERQGIAVSTLGKIIRRGWDWIGLAPARPQQVAGLIEVPGLAAALTLNKGDFIRTGRRGMTYLAYRKAIQEAISAPLAAWGDAPEQDDSARRRAARPLERDLEAVLVDLADAFPAIGALVERRSGGQKRLPTATDPSGKAMESLLSAAAALEADAANPPAEPAAASLSSGEGGTTESEPAPVADPPVTEPPAASSLPLSGDRGPRRPARYGLGIDFEDRPELPDLGRLVESTVLVNTAHPAHTRAVASHAEGYHLALAVGMAVAAIAVEPRKSQEFLTAFLARWGEALGRDRRRRQPSLGRRG